MQAAQALRQHFGSDLQVQLATHPPPPLQASAGTEAALAIAGGRLLVVIAAGSAPDHATQAQSCTRQRALYRRRLRCSWPSSRVLQPDARPPLNALPPFPRRHPVGHAGAGAVYGAAGGAGGGGRRAAGSTVPAAAGHRPASRCALWSSRGNSLQPAGVCCAAAADASPSRQVQRLLLLCRPCLLLCRRLEGAWGGGGNKLALFVLRACLLQCKGPGQMPRRSLRPTGVHDLHKGLTHPFRTMPCAGYWQTMQEKKAGIMLGIWFIGELEIISHVDCFHGKLGHCSSCQLLPQTSLRWWLCGSRSAQPAPKDL